MKDFHWDKTAKGWEIKKVPLGQGMVDVAGIFGILAKHNFSGPVSLHLEYAIEGGARRRAQGRRARPRLPEEAARYGVRRRPNR